MAPCHTAKATAAASLSAAARREDHQQVLKQNGGGDSKKFVAAGEVLEPEMHEEIMEEAEAEKEELDPFERRCCIRTLYGV